MIRPDAGPDRWHALWVYQLRDAEWFGEPYGFNELHVVSDRPDNKIWSQQVVNRVKAKAEKAGYTIPMTMTADPGQLPMDDVLQGILLLMGFLA